MRILACALMVTVFAISFSQRSDTPRPLTKTQLEQFEKLQDSIQDDAKFDIGSILISYSLPKLNNNQLILTERTIGQSRGDFLFRKVATYDLKWNNIGSIKLDEKKVVLTFVKPVAMTFEEVEFQDRKTTGKEDRKEIIIFYEKTAQARSALKLFQYFLNEFKQKPRK